MATTIRSSAARLANAFGRGFEAATSPADEPGAPISVAPFERGDIPETGTVTMKALASLLAGRRAAANARDDRLQAGRDRQYRDLQIARLQQQTAEPARRELEVPGTGLKVQASDEDIIGHPGTFRAPAAGAGVQRVPLLPAYRGAASEFGADYDPATGTVSKAMLDQFERNRLRGDVNRRFEKGFGLREKSGDRAQAGFDDRTAHAAISRSEEMLQALDKEAAVSADEAATKATAEAENALRVLQEPSISPTKKAYYARLLGVRYMMHQPEAGKPGTEAMRDHLGNPIYDLRPATTKLALERFVEARRKKALDTARSQQSAERIFHAERRRSAAGYFSGPQPNQPAPAAGDPLDDVRELMNLYGSTGNPRDLQNIPDDQPIED